MSIGDRNVPGSARWLLSKEGIRCRRNENTCLYARSTFPTGTHRLAEAGRLRRRTCSGCAPLEGRGLSRCAVSFNHTLLCCLVNFGDSFWKCLGNSRGIPRSDGLLGLFDIGFHACAYRQISYAPLFVGEDSLFLLLIVRHSAETPLSLWSSW